MKTLTMALRSIRCRKISFAIIFAQLSISISIIICTVCALLYQFNILYTAGDTVENYLRLTRDVVFVDDYRYNYQSSVDFFIMMQDYMNENQLEQVTDEQYYEIYKEYTELQDEEFDQNHYLGKYQYVDLYEVLTDSGLVTDILSNYSTLAAYKANNGERYDVSVTMMEGELYDDLRFNTKHGTNLHNYSNADVPNYFYAVMYPNISIGNEEYKVPYGVGDVIVDTHVYNIKEHRFETFYYEIIDEFSEPAYALTSLEYSGTSERYTYIEQAFLSEQEMKHNGSLIVLKPEGFDRMAYYMNFDECFTMVKLREDITSEEYSEFLDKTIACGFNTIDLNKAKENTITSIWQYIRENSFILIAAMLMVAFSIISISALLGNRVKYEYAIYKLCGADKNKLKIISAVKWAMIFIPAMIFGIFIAWIYLCVNSLSVRFIPISAAFSSAVFIIMYLLSVALSYKAAVSAGSTNNISEENND